MSDASRELLSQLNKALLELDPEVVGVIDLQADRIVLHDGQLILTVDFPDREENGDTTHAHVIAHLQSWDGKTLDACMMGCFGSSDNPFVNIAVRWCRLAAPPIFSLVCGREVLGARSFKGHEPWGVSRRYGYAGPLVLLAAQPKDSRISVDQPRLTEMLSIVETKEPIYVNAPELICDDNIHIVKVVINNMNEDRQWRRSLEFDDHSFCIEELEWPPYSLNIDSVLLPTNNPLGVIGFAVFYRPEDYQPRTEEEEIDEEIERTMKLLSENDGFEISVSSLIEAGVGKKWARDIGWLVPLAFGRFSFLLDGLSVDLLNVYFIVDGNGGYEIRSLDDEPVFRRATIHAVSYAFTPKRQDAFERLAECGPEKSYVDSEIERGNAPCSLETVPAIFWEPGTDESVLKSAMERICFDVIRPLETEMRRSSKKWWQFWK